MSWVKNFFLFFTLLFSWSFLIPSAFAQILNGGFEGGTTTTADRWTAFTNGGATSQRCDEDTDGALADCDSFAGAMDPRSGNFAWYANAFGAASGGAYQNMFGVREGDIVTFNGFIRSDNGALPAYGEIRIEFMNNAGTILETRDSEDVIGGSGGYIAVSASGPAPRGTTFARLTISSNVPGGFGDWLWDDLTASVSFGGLPVSDDAVFPVNISSNLSSATHQGDVITVLTRINNATVVTIPNVELVVQAPAGFNFLSDRAVRVGQGPLQTLSGTESTLIIGDMAAGETVEIVFQVVVTSGALPGHNYEISVFARSGVTGGAVSRVSRMTVRIKNDPVFDEGTILGKVFDDRNGDGVQNKGEIGVPHVRIFTEYGVSVVTDRHGRFHIPAVKPGRHVLKIDGHTLPQGTSFITEESLLVKTTPGLLNKVRFAVRLPESALPDEFKKDLKIWVSQGIDLTQPILRVTLDPDILKMRAGRFEREPIFRTQINYGDYVRDWRIEVRNEMGEEVWAGVGISQPPSEIPWNGMNDAGEPLRPGVYAYRLVVKDSEYREDWTPYQFFRVAGKTEGIDAEEDLPIPRVGHFNIFQDGRRSIPLVAKPTLRIYGKTEPNRRVRINEAPVEVGPTGEFEQELFVNSGEKKVVVSATSPEGETVTVEETVSVKDSYFFMVALGEEELGVNFMDGNLETVARDDTFHEDFYHDGRLAYYLKAKIKGKFLVKSRYDTSDERTELFTRLDPDDYYPVYGDYSQLEYEGQDTREKFFILVEMDRSFVKWGSFETDFTDTEMGRYNRTLSGLKLHYEALAATKYGDSKRGFTLFWSRAETLADHNEFWATGGTLYYLRNRNVVPGSEKVRIEIRDKIQDLSVQTRDLIAGQDYDIDYKQGRILLKEPLTSRAASETIISNDILDGNPVFLIVDYEFENFQFFRNKAMGIRGFTHLGDHIRLGGTAVEDDRGVADYDLRAVDATVKLGKNTKVTAEFAQAKFQQVRQAFSADGGLSFTNAGPLPIRRPREKAYLIKAESKPLKPLEVSGYIQHVAPGFSIDRSISQEGLRKYGFQARLKLNQHFQLLGRHDSTELSSQLRPIVEKGILAVYDRVRSTTGQAMFNYGGWNIIGEYLHQNLDIPVDNRLDSFFSQVPFGNAFGLRIAKRVNDWLTPFIRGQITFSRKQNYQLGGGLEVRANDKVKIQLEEVIGSIGDSTLLSVSLQKDEKTSSYASIRVGNDRFGDKQISTAVGSSHQLSERSRFYSEREYSTYSGYLPLSLVPASLHQQVYGYTPGVWSSDIYGYETQFWDRWEFGLRFERRHLDADDFRTLNERALTHQVRTNTFNTLAGSLGYTDPQRIHWDSSLEVRLESDTPEVRQWVTQNMVDWKINQDLSFLGRVNFGNSRFLKPAKLTGRFLELNIGFAYRPVESDRFNGLFRYTYLTEAASDAQFLSSEISPIAVDQNSHLVSLEGAYDLFPYLQIVEKAAYRMANFRNSVRDEWVNLHTFLWVNRFNFHITRKWDLALEYRLLFQGDAADTIRHGPLVEIERELYDYVRLGMGYNFTDFDDDLRKLNDFRRNGIFVRLTGKV